jgi:hypothetical protein
MRRSLPKVGCIPGFAEGLTDDLLKPSFVRLMTHSAGKIELPYPLTQVNFLIVPLICEQLLRLESVSPVNACCPGNIDTPEFVVAPRVFTNVLFLTFGNQVHTTYDPNHRGKDRCRSRSHQAGE